MTNEDMENSLLLEELDDVVQSLSFASNKVWCHWEIPSDPKYDSEWFKQQDKFYEIKKKLAKRLGLKIMIRW